MSGIKRESCSRCLELEAEIERLNSQVERLKAFSHKLGELLDYAREHKAGPKPKPLAEITKRRLQQLEAERKRGGRAGCSPLDFWFGDTLKSVLDQQRAKKRAK